MSMAEWAENEVRLACKKENPDWDGESFDYGCACYQSALKAYKSLCEDGHSGMSLGITKNILIRLMNEKPLTPIEDIPESWRLVCVDDDGTEKYLCNRMPGLFKSISPDGTINYSDINSYYCKDFITGLTYHGGGAMDILSKYVKPITFPYCPPQGWQCPICKRVYSPTTPMCYYCGNVEVKTSNTFTTTNATTNKYIDWLHHDSVTNAEEQEGGKAK